MNPAPHIQAFDCDGKHCWFHHVDEPDGEESCLECGHSWATSADLLADHNRVAAENDSPGADRVEDVFTCPYCTHDL